MLIGAVACMQRLVLVATCIVKFNDMSFSAIPVANGVS